MTFSQNQKPNEIKILLSWTYYAIKCVAEKLMKKKYYKRDSSENKKIRLIVEYYEKVDVIYSIGIQKIAFDAKKTKTSVYYTYIRERFSDLTVWFS